MSATNFAGDGWLYSYGGQRPCPSCGHCPTCGRGGHGPYDYHPIWVIPPQTATPAPWPWTTWCGGTTSDTIPTTATNTR